MFLKRKKKENPEIAVIENIIEQQKEYKHEVRIPISDRYIDDIKKWCERRNYRIELEYTVLTPRENHYKIYGWD